MKPFRLFFTKYAESALEISYQYIRQETAVDEFAKEWLAGMKKACFSLTMFPRRYPILQKEPWKSLEYRKFPFKNFIIYYRVKEDEGVIFIVAIAHSRQDQWRILRETES